MRSSLYLQATWILFILFASVVVFAENRRISDPEMLSEMLRALESQPKYMGFKSHYKDDGRGTFCQKDSNWWVAWQAEVDHVDVELRPEAGAIDVELGFINVALEAGGMRTGGLLCTPMGGSGRARLNNFFIKLSIIKEDPHSKDPPLFHLGALKMKGLKIDRIDHSLLLFNGLNGTAPNWLNQFLEKNINAISHAAIHSSLSKRIDAKLSKTIADWLEWMRESQGLTLKAPL